MLELNQRTVAENRIPVSPVCSLHHSCFGIRKRQSPPHQRCCNTSR